MDPDHVPRTAALERIQRVGGGRLIEPAVAYEVREAQDAVLHIAAGPGEERISDLDATGQDNVVVTGLHAAVDRIGRIVVRGTRNVVFLGPHCRFAKLSIEIAGDGNTVYLGAFSTGGQLQVQVHGIDRTVLLGDDCMLSNRVVVGLGPQPVVFAADGEVFNPFQTSEDEANHTVIDDHCWIGREALIADGAHIGRDVVVGASSFVMADVPASSIVAGAPARVLRTGVTWSKATAESVEAEIESGPHKQNSRLRSALRERIASLVEADRASSVASATVRTHAASQSRSARPDPVVAGVPAKLGAAEMAAALSRLRELAAGEPIDGNWTAPLAFRAGLALHLSADGSRVRDIRSKFRGCLVFTAEGCDLSGLVIAFAAPDSVVYIGPHTKMREACTIRVHAGTGSYIHIGALCEMNTVGFLVNGPGGRVVLGDDTVIERNTVISNSDMHSIYDVETGRSINPDRHVRIGDHVHIGRETRVNKGASIGAGAVVGPRSVVTGALEGGAYHLGIPARPLKHGIVWAREGAPPTLEELAADPDHIARENLLARLREQRLSSD